RLRTALADWLKAYGESNGYVGLATGTLDARFARLCDRVGSTAALAWTTPALWAAQGARVLVQFPDIGLQLDCALTDADRLLATAVDVVNATEPDPREQADAIGVALLPTRVMFDAEPNPGAQTIAMVVRGAAASWTDFVAPLRQLLDVAE